MKRMPHRVTGYFVCIYSLYVSFVYVCVCKLFFTNLLKFEWHFASAQEGIRFQGLIWEVKNVNK